MDHYNELNALGWDDFFDRHFENQSQGLEPARIIMRSKDLYTVLCKSGELKAKLSGKLKREMAINGDYPVVGDFVGIDADRKGPFQTIHALVPRKSRFSRKPAISGGRKLKNGIMQGGSTAEQVLAANVDTVFIVSGLDGNFNLNRIERYLTIADQSGAKAVILLNKSDLCSSPESFVKQVRQLSEGTPVACISMATGAGLEIFEGYMTSGKTLVFLGSSGVGKSTIINGLFGDSRQKTKATSLSNGKGKHTTTCSELLIHETGCMLIDTPGLRELKLWCDEEALDERFSDIVKLSESCRYVNCRHQDDLGCEVQEALKSGVLSKERYQHYVKLKAEIGALNARKKQKEIYLARLKKRSLSGSERGTCR